MYYYIFVTLYPKLQNLSLIGQGYKKKKVRLSSSLCPINFSILYFAALFWILFSFGVFLVEFLILLWT